MDEDEHEEQRLFGQSNGEDEDDVNSDCEDDYYNEDVNL